MTAVTWNGLSYNSVNDIASKSILSKGISVPLSRLNLIQGPFLAFSH